MGPRLGFALLLLLLVACGSGTPDAEPESGLAIDANARRVRVTMHDRPVFEYVLDDRLPADAAAYYTRSGFIDSVYSPGGHLLTDDFPVGHTHQHGIFTAWTSTTFRGEHLDFWNQHEGTGTARHAELLEVLDAAALVGFRARLEQVSLEHGPVLREDWRVRVYPSAEPYVWDLRSEQTNVTDDTLYLDQYTYGGLGVRGSAAWNAVDSLHFREPAYFLTSRGDFRAAANHTRPEWTAIYGQLSGLNGDGTAGLAVFPHPGNFRAPQYVRVHPDMPYLSVTPVVEAGFAIAPGETYVSRYRFVTFDGEPGGIDLAAYGWGRYPAD